MTAANFGLMLFKEADAELQQEYPDAIWFALSSKGMTISEVKTRTMMLSQTSREHGVFFMKQDKEFKGQIVWVGETAAFGGLI